MNKRQIITLAGELPRQTIRARIVTPDLAIHRTMHVSGLKTGEEKLPWTITHIPTGYWIAQSKTQPQARRIVAVIKDLIDWSEVTPEGPPRNKRNVILQAICAIKEVAK